MNELIDDLFSSDPYNKEKFFKKLKLLCQIFNNEYRNHEDISFNFNYNA